MSLPDSIFINYSHHVLVKNGDKGLFVEYYYPVYNKICGMIIIVPQSSAVGLGLEGIATLEEM